MEPAPILVRGSAFAFGGDAWGTLASLDRGIKCVKSPLHAVAVRVRGKGLRGCERRELTKPLKPQRPLLQVRRNLRRFPADFMFQLSPDEAVGLRSQNATLEPGRGRYRKYLPYVFTEHGVAMLSSVLKSERAVQVNVEIMRAFVRLRELIATNRDLARRLDEVEKRYDAQFKTVFDAIRQLMAPPQKTRRSIGFRVEEPRPAYGRPRRAWRAVRNT